MKDKEVIETLNDMKGVFGKRGHSQYSLYSIDRAIAAIEKQTPKKPIVTSKGEEEYSGCPVCNKFVFDDYCQCCGQAIDWE